MISLALTFAVGAGVGASGAYMYVSKSSSSAAIVAPPPAPIVDEPSTKKTVQPATDLQYSPTLKYGVPVSDYLRFFTDYVASFDSRTRNPRWVIERLTKDSVAGVGNRKNSEFFEDTAIEERFRNKLSDFRRSGYDRGHLAPASNHKSSQQAMDDTFTLSNMSPQVGEGFNRDYWARFEEFARTLTKQADEVFVVTGPLFLPTLGPNNRWQMRYDLLGRAPQLTSIPTHFYKVVLMESKGKSASVGAFVLPNAPIDPNSPLAAFVVPLEDLESVAGTKFFPYFLTDEKRKVTDSAARHIASEGRRMLPAANTNLLPAPITESTVVAAKPSLVPTSTRDGTVHLCQAVACRLPSERFWEAAKKP